MPEAGTAAGRIVLVNPGVMRAVSLIPEGSQLIALAVHGDAEKLTYLPPQTALFTCEKTEDGALRLNTADGWLYPGAENRTLVLDAEAGTPAEWTLTDTDLTARSASPEAGKLNHLTQDKKLPFQPDARMAETGESAVFSDCVTFRSPQGPVRDRRGCRRHVRYRQTAGQDPVRRRPQ